jgi:hypothetical protein
MWKEDPCNTIKGMSNSLARPLTLNSPNQENSLWLIMIVAPLVLSVANHTLNVLLLALGRLTIGMILSHCYRLKKQELSLISDCYLRSYSLSNAS